MRGSAKLKSEESKKKSTIWEYAEAVIIGLVLGLVIRTFVVQAFTITSESMQPILEIGDHLPVNKFIYGIKVPFTSIHLFLLRSSQRGDVIVFIYPLEPDKGYIKRAIGVGGMKGIRKTRSR